MNELEIEQRLKKLEETYAQNLNASIARNFADNLIQAQILATLATLQPNPAEFLEKAKGAALSTARTLDNGTVPKAFIEQVLVRVEQTFSVVSGAIPNATGV